MLRGKNINLFLMDGDASGRIKCTLANWTGVAYKIPRTEIEKCKNREDLKWCSVYFLFGVSDDTGENIAYIGQAGIRKNGEGILYRLKDNPYPAKGNRKDQALSVMQEHRSHYPLIICSFLFSPRCLENLLRYVYSVKRKTLQYPDDVFSAAFIYHNGISCPFVYFCFLYFRKTSKIVIESIRLPAR